MLKNTSKLAFIKKRGVLIPLLLFLLLFGLIFEVKSVLIWTNNADSILTTQPPNYFLRYKENNWNDLEVLSIVIKISTSSPPIPTNYLELKDLSNYWNMACFQFTTSTIIGNYQLQEYDRIKMGGYPPYCLLDDWETAPFIIDPYPDQGIYFQINPSQNLIDFFGTMDGDYYLIGWGPYGEPQNLRDVYLEFHNTTSTLIKNKLDFIYPDNNFYLKDFQNWKLNYASNEAYKIEITYYNYSETSPIYQDIIYNLTPTLLEKEILIPKGNILTKDVWLAFAKLKNINNEILAEDDILFNIILEYESGDPLPPGTTCEGGNWFENSLCVILSYLFIPSSNSLNRFSTFYEDIKNKPPIGYFYAIKNTLGGISNTTTPAFVLPNYGVLNTYIFNPIRTGITFILWLAFAFWLFNRIRHFEL